MVFSFGEVRDYQHLEAPHDPQTNPSPKGGGRRLDLKNLDVQVRVAVVGHELEDAVVDGPPRPSRTRWWRGVDSGREEVIDKRTLRCTPLV